MGAHGGDVKWPHPPTSFLRKRTFVDMEIQIMKNIFQKSQLQNLNPSHRQYQFLHPPPFFSLCAVIFNEKVWKLVLLNYMWSLRWVSYITSASGLSKKRHQSLLQWERKGWDIGWEFLFFFKNAICVFLYIFYYPLRFPFISLYSSGNYPGSPLFRLHYFNNSTCGNDKFYPKCHAVRSKPSHLTAHAQVDCWWKRAFDTIEKINIHFFLFDRVQSLATILFESLQPSYEDLYIHRRKSEKIEKLTRFHIY